MQEIFTPVKMIITLAKNDLFLQVWEAVELYIEFITFTDSLQENTYKGSEFCKGLIMGMNGTRMILAVANIAINLGKR